MQSTPSTMRTILVLASLLALAAHAAVAQTANSAPTCGGKQRGEQRLGACRADARFNPTSVGVRMAYGWALMESERWPEAVAEFDALANTGPAAGEAQ